MHIQLIFSWSANIFKMKYITKEVITAFVDDSFGSDNGSYGDI